MIYFDEAADMPMYKWYRNPIEWWRWRRLFRTIRKSNKHVIFLSTPKGKRR